MAKKQDGLALILRVSLIRRTTCTSKVASLPRQQPQEWDSIPTPMIFAATLPPHMAIAATRMIVMSQLIGMAIPLRTTGAMLGKTGRPSNPMYAMIGRKTTRAHGKISKTPFTMHGTECEAIPPLRLQLETAPHSNVRLRVETLG